MSAYAFPRTMPNAAPATLCLRYGFHGPTFAVNSACAASADAIGTAAALIRTGAADAMVTGGTEASLTPYAIAGFARTGALSASGVSRPFDARRDGFVDAEGAAGLTLESEELVQRRGAVPLAEVAGFASGNDAYHLTLPEPTGAGQAATMTAALEDAGAAPDDVVYVNAHGTEFEAEPWRHDWAGWLGNSMSVSTVPSAALVWTETKRWNLTCRCSFKSWAAAIFEFLEWLGPFIDDNYPPDRPRLVGYIEDAGERRPYLLWAQNRRLLIEDLNTPVGPN